ncbi:MAG: glycosyltransferase family 2 protein [Desulfobacteraceae bacterium]|nr:MAG: glycosyltransferase family 2 protein [Desulfobacteraceae bacterium]
MKLSIVIPVFNEEDGIEKHLYELEEYMNQYDGCDSWEIITVNDGSTDATLTKLLQIEYRKKWLKVVDLVTNFGRGKALRKGIENATGDIIISLDADLSYAPYHIERLVDKLVKNNADIVLASAYGKGGTVKNVPFKRLWISRVGNKVLSYMFGENLSVLTCIVRAYRNEFIKKVDLHSNDKDIHLEILYKAKILGAKILEVPADLRWSDEKVSELEKPVKRRSTMKFRKTTSSHFFFALMNKPGFVFLMPGFCLLTVAAVVFLITASAVLSQLMEGISLYHALRNSMLTATPSWLTFALSFILAFQFFSLGFLTNQNKKNHEELYKTINKIFRNSKTGAK